MSAGIRLTPYELAFPAEPFANEIFPAIRQEAESRGVSTTSAERFLMLATVAEQLRELQPESDRDARKAGSADTATDAGLPAARAVGQYGALLYQAFRFWDTGCRFLTLDEAVVRDIAGAGREAGDWQFHAIHPSGYIQFPRNLVWGRIDEGAPAESVDGLFWTITDEAGGRTGRMDLLLVLGMHPARPGFSVVEATAPMPAPIPGHWGDIQARADGADFQNILPGGELRDLLALTSVPELLKFVSRLFHYIDRWPECVDSPVIAADAPQGAVHELRSSALAASVVRLCG